MNIKELSLNLRNFKSQILDKSYADKESISQLSEEITDKIIEPDGKSIIIKDKKLTVSTENIVETPIETVFEKGGFYLDSAGSHETTFGSYYKTDYISVGQNTMLNVSIDDDRYYVRAVAYVKTEGNNSNTSIQFDDSKYKNKSYKEFNPMLFVRFLVRYSEDGGNTFIAVPTPIPVTVTQTENVSSINDYLKSQNPLYGKTMLFNGDSICRGANSGGIAYAELIAENDGAIVTNDAVSGTTIANYGDDSTIRERVQSRTEKFDYIVLEGGYNDCAYKVPLGTITNGYDDVFDEDTFVGALESMFKYCLDTWFLSKKLFIIPHKMLNNNVNEYYDKAIEVCIKWGIPYIDLRVESNLIPAYSEEIQIKYFQGKGTGVHPNLEAYRTFYYPKISEKLKML